MHDLRELLEKCFACEELQPFIVKVAEQSTLADNGYICDVAVVPTPPDADDAKQRKYAQLRATLGEGVQILVMVPRKGALNVQVTGMSMAPPDIYEHTNAWNADFEHVTHVFGMRFLNRLFTWVVSTTMVLPASQIESSSTHALVATNICSMILETLMWRDYITSVAPKDPVVRHH